MQQHVSLKLGQGTQRIYKVFMQSFVNQKAKDFEFSLCIKLKSESLKLAELPPANFCLSEAFVLINQKFSWRMWVPLR
jgi:hypothetical protein